MITQPSQDHSFDKYMEYEIHMEKFLSIKLIEFDLPFKLVSMLDRYGIKTLRDLVSHSAGSLRTFPQLGKGYVSQLEKFLSGLRLSLKKD